MVKKIIDAEAVTIVQRHCDERTVSMTVPRDSNTGTSVSQQPTGGPATQSYLVGSPQPTLVAQSITSPSIPAVRQIPTQPVQPTSARQSQMRRVGQSEWDPQLQRYKRHNREESRWEIYNHETQVWESWT